MLHLLPFDDLAALLRALVSAADVHEPLPLALVLALAGVARSGARPLAFAGVDTGTVHFSASLLVCVRADIAGEDERSSRARDQHPFPNRAIHDVSFRAKSLLHSLCHLALAFRERFVLFRCRHVGFHETVTMLVEMEFLYPVAAGLAVGFGHLSVRLGRGARLGGLGVVFIGDPP